MILDVDESSFFQDSTEMFFPTKPINKPSKCSESPRKRNVSSLPFPKNFLMNSDAPSRIKSDCLHTSATEISSSQKNNKEEKNYAADENFTRQDYSLLEERIDYEEPTYSSDIRYTTDCKESVSSKVNNLTNECDKDTQHANLVNNVHDSIYDNNNGLIQNQLETGSQSDLNFSRARPTQLKPLTKRPSVPNSKMVRRRSSQNRRLTIHADNTSLATADSAEICQVSDDVQVPIRNNDDPPTLLTCADSKLIRSDSMAKSSTTITCHMESDPLSTIHSSKFERSLDEDVEYLDILDGAKVTATPRSFRDTLPVSWTQSTDQLSSFGEELRSPDFPSRQHTQVFDGNATGQPSSTASAKDGVLPFDAHVPEEDDIDLRAKASRLLERSLPNRRDDILRDDVHRTHLTEGALIQSARLHSLAAYAKRTVERKEVELISKRVIELGDQKYGFVSEQIVNDHLRKITVSFRGTVSLSDWLVDINFVESDLKLCLGLCGHCHTGFKDRYMLIREELKKILHNMDPEGWMHPHHHQHHHQHHGNHDQQPLRSVASSEVRTVYVFTGHSLGGALANLAAIDFRVNFKLHNTYCITFSSPRCFDRTACELFNYVMRGKSYRLAVLGDFITSVSWFGRYVHVDRMILFNAKGIDYSSNNVSNNNLRISSSQKMATTVTRSLKSMKTAKHLHDLTHYRHDSLANEVWNGIRNQLISERRASRSSSQFRNQLKRIIG